VSTEARLHHTVPRFYLKGFAKEGKLVTVELPGDRRFTQNVSQAAAVNYFYSVPGHPDGSDVFERALSKVEGDAARVLRLVLEEGMWPLSAVDRAVLATFMTLQFLRGPDHRRQMEEIATAAARLLVQATGRDGFLRQAESGGERMSEDEAARTWKLLSAENAIQASVSASGHIDQILHLLPQLVRYIVGRPWILVRFTQRSLITSDTPLSPLPDPKSDPYGRVGLMTAWGMTFPLNRQAGLILASPDPFIDAAQDAEAVRRGTFDRQQKGTTQYERFFNVSTSVNARRWIFHHPDDARFVPPELPDPSDGPMRAETILRDVIQNADPAGHA